ncbi:MAG: CPBP family intramembrane metalloprotease [Planctomycetota bacterium]|nr:CPBP family intramembrane metalloprotease [Planctomycetota bacterium]
MDARFHILLLGLTLLSGVLFLLRRAALAAALADLWQTRAATAEIWRWHDLFLALGIWLAIAGGGMVFERHFGLEAPLPRWPAFLAQMAQAMALVIFLGYQRAARAAPPFVWQSAARAAFAYIIFFPALTALVMVCNLWVPTVADYLGLEVRAMQPQVERFLDALSSPVARAAFIMNAVLCAPLGEEILLRGYLFGVLRQRLAWPTAAALDGAIFAFLHQDAVRFFPLLALGMFLCALRERTQTLAAPIVGHALHNGLALLFAWLGAEGVR